MPLLEDIDPRVIVSAGLVLRAWTCEDFGIRLVQARPEFTGPRTPNPKDFDLERIGQGVQRWKDWWNEHGNEYTKPNEGSSSESLATRFRAANFTLTSLNGKKVRLKDYRGQIVLLGFWDPKTEECLDQFPALIELQRRQTKRLVVLGIALNRTEAGRSTMRMRMKIACGHRSGRRQIHSALRTSWSARGSTLRFDRRRRFGGTALRHRAAGPRAHDAKGSLQEVLAAETPPLSKQ